MTSDRSVSEQQENLELEAEPRPEDDPRSWAAADPDTAEETAGFPPGNQVSPPGGSTPPDREPTEIAEDAGTDTTVGPEQQAVRRVSEEQAIRKVRE